MRSLKNHKAAGGDGIPAELLKYSGGTGVQVLTHLFNAVLATRCVPYAWRKGIVVHLAKVGDRGDCSNYRPVTLLSIIDKLFAMLLSGIRLHVWYACTSSNRCSDLAEAHSIRYTTCWQSCGNELRLTKPRTRVSLMLRKLTTLYRTLSCSTVFSNVVHRDPPLRYWRLCTRLHPAGCGLGQPSPQPLRCDAGSHKGAPCPRCCMQSL